MSEDSNRICLSLEDLEMELEEEQELSETGLGVVSPTTVMDIVRRIGDKDECDELVETTSKFARITKQLREQIDQMECPKRLRIFVEKNPPNTGTRDFCYFLPEKIGKTEGMLLCGTEKHKGKEIEIDFASDVTGLVTEFALTEKELGQELRDYFGGDYEELK